VSSPTGSPERRGRIAFIGSSRDQLSAITGLRKMPSPPSISTSRRFALMAERRGNEFSTKCRRASPEGRAGLHASFHRGRR
jgi:hypothetical protein